MMIKKIGRSVLNLYRNPLWRRTWTSETSKCRDSLSQYCVGDGIDVGFGGDPIVKHAICMDLPQKYATYRSHTQHLHGSAENLIWFKDASLDWVYSSHVLEDFRDTESVLREWIRVLKPGGNLILFLPDEQVYRSFCRQKGRTPNAHHIHANFGLKFVAEILGRIGGVSIIHSKFPIGVYSFELVAKKTL